jgi:nitroreductase
MVMSLIRKRRSIRRFLPRPVEVEKVNVLLEAALRAPSSRGVNPWELVVLTEQNLLKELSRAKQHGSTFLKDAPLGIVVCADPEKCDVWIEDASIAAIFIQLTAESLGLGSCWVQIRERMHDETKSAEEYVAGILKIPAQLKVASIIAIGYPDEQKSPHKADELLYEKVHTDMYGRPYFTAIV